MSLLLSEIQGNSKDFLWSRMRREAEEGIAVDPTMLGFLGSSILEQNGLEEALINRLLSRFSHHAFDFHVLENAFYEATASINNWTKIVQKDIFAVFERDPTVHRFLDVILYFKGFHALQIHRIAHVLWNKQRKDFAYYLQSCSSSLFQTDIHPAARIGSGIFLDHATGIVIGETSLIEDNVSILHSVTLGGTGKSGGDRHPKIRRCVLIGAGAKILGNIEVGFCSKVASGSVVLSDVPPHVTVAGIPATILGKTGSEAPAQSMDQTFSCGDGI
ncbi:MAG: serine O-acetyltransferase [Candidatus Tokpelaia sp. JSC161]|nr:MAG: serine O-acetyltransferase [Candidatus Tokpelaia sp. JSC161]